MKRLLCMFWVVVTVMFVGNLQNRVEAADFYLGEYETGQIAYLDTNSIRDYQVTRNGYWVNDQYECSVKAVDPASNQFNLVSYEVTYSEGIIEYMVSKNGTKLYDRHTMHQYLNSHPVERNLIEYFRHLRRSQGKS